MKKAKSIAIFVLAIVLVFQMPVCLASGLKAETQEKEIKNVVESYLSRYADVVYEFGTDDFSKGTITSYFVGENSELSRLETENALFKAAKQNSDFLNLKSEYFKKFRIKNRIFRENCRYKYEYHDITLNEDVATVRVSEYAYFNYVNDPIESVLESVFNISLSRIGEDWTIVEVIEESWFDATYSELDITEAKHALDELAQVDLFASSVGIIEPEVDLAATNYRIYYDKINASAYAMTYSTSSGSSTSFYNQNFSDWTSYGDCQNFASQCVWAGFYGNNTTSAIDAHGVPMDKEGSNIWYGSSSMWGETPSWRGCDNFRTYITNSKNDSDIGIYGNIYDIAANSGVTGVSYLSLQGSVIQVDGYLNQQLTPYNHSVVVDTATGLSRNEIYCCGHTNMAKHVKLSEINSSCAAKLIIPSYFRSESSTGNMLKGRYMNPIAKGTTTTVKCFTDNVQYKMTIQIHAPSGSYVSTSDYSCDELVFSHTFSEKGLYRITTYAKPNSENDTAAVYQFYVRVY